ncbi:MAG: rod shape-determining protein MreD [Candidatus Omnitrophica bacterium]|nr:rod shape-determining protein MreD [Candidatus Omnitrophota bacterium]
MQKFLFVLTVSLICLVPQILCLKVFGAGLVPNFVLIAVIFLNLYRGMNYSLGAAFLGGFFLDSFSGSILGVNVLTFVLCVFLTGTLKMYIYQPGVAESRVLIVFVIVLVNGFLQYFINLIAGVDLPFGEALGRAILPEVILTTFFANVTFERLKDCALKLFA